MVLKNESSIPIANGRPHGPEARKRSLYIYQQRTLTMPFLQAFDGLVCEDSMPRRALSVTPLQALEMYGQLVKKKRLTLRRA